MKQKSGMIGVVYAAILSAIAGYFFRMTQLLIKVFVTSG